MAATQRLFDQRPYDDKFTAVVTEIADDYIILDRTLFYPLSGNQEFDAGTLNGQTVTAVYVDESEDGRLALDAPIKHYVENPGAFNIGQPVEGIIDRERRLRTMRLHTASHLVEQFITALPGYLSTEGSFVNQEKDRTDYRMSANIDADGLAVLESQINDYIAAGHPVTFSVENGVRTWQCHGVEMPCCGTHVANISEIGRVQLSRKNKGKGVNRIETRLVD
ncbi:serine-tRNA(Ala) deacylase AlaX [Salmonella enterica subsp. enterica serovar Choleraesuis]|nr:serine-tRNA(Ala) deacylase AlaX [Salmonella enterica subsp. enterica serovar Choleraesuis]